MPATIAPATFPATEIMPTIVHNHPGQVITIYVVVSLNPDGKDITIAAAPVAVPQKVWTLRWTLMVATPGLQAEFGNPGVLIDPALLPPMVAVDGAVDQKDHCTRQLTNNVKGANQFSYLISVTWMKGNSEATVKTVHDPTIAVTQDPVGKIIQPGG